MLIASINDCGIREFIEQSIKQIGVHHTKENLKAITQHYSDPQGLGMRAQKDKLDDLSFVLMLIFNWVLCCGNIAHVVDSLVDDVARNMERKSK